MIVFQNIAWLLVLIGVMILVHELGHYLVARFFDVRIEVFQFRIWPPPVRIQAWRNGFPFLGHSVRRVRKDGR
jgi:regulator of sigma E protease